MIIGAKKSQDQPLTRWRPRKLMVKMQSLEKQNSQWYKFHAEKVVSSSPKSRPYFSKREVDSSFLLRGAFLFYSDLQLIE
jgi:hypothetical protein